MTAPRRNSLGAFMWQKYGYYGMIWDIDGMLFCENYYLGV